MSGLLTVMLSVAFLVTACAEAPQANIEGRDFILVDLAGWPEPLVPGTTVRLSFSNGQIRANAGCNHLLAGYRLSGGQLIVDQVGTTDIGCDAARHAQDERLAGFLASEPQVQLEGDLLVLHGGPVTATLRDRRVVEPDLPLVGTEWRLVGIIEGDAISSVPEAVDSTIRFGADGRFEVRPGCNTGGGQYGETGATLSFGPIALTRMACPGDGDQVEAAVMAVLQGDVDYRIESGTLTLASAGRGLQYGGR